MMTNTICTARVAASVSIIVVHIEYTWSMLILSESSTMKGMTLVIVFGLSRSDRLTTKDTNLMDIFIRLYIFHPQKS
jgi:hypothetical protein